MKAYCFLKTVRVKYEYITYSYSMPSTDLKDCANDMDLLEKLWWEIREKLKKSIILDLSHKVVPEFREKLKLLF